ncbi:MAG: PorP/SprF family type IX secretion system membrane protein [Bacteroidota bacterium]
MKINYTSIRFVVIFLVAFGFHQTAQAQDPHFSQFYAAPLQMNPALTGVFSGEYRFIANYRTQNYAVLGNQAYRSIAASFEGRRQASRDDYYSFGIAALRDQVGTSNFSQSRAVVSGSYLKHLGSGVSRGSSQFLVGGAQLGVAQWTYDFNDLWFSEQFTVSGDNRDAFIDFAAASGEAGNLLSTETDMFMEFNAGLLYYYVKDETNSFYLGGAMHHLTEPNVSFLDNQNETLHRRWVAQAGGQLELNREVSLLPAVAVMSQASSFLAIGGMNLRYSNNDWREVAIRAGLWGRVVNQLEDAMGLDAVVVSAILEMERWQFGLNYDITVSGLSEANNARGAFELSLIYVHPAKQRYRTVCPKF